MPSAKATLFPSRYDNLLTSDGYFAIKDEEKPIYDNAFIDEFIKSKNITEQEDIDYINEQAKLLKDEFRNLTNTPRFIPSQEQASDLYLPQPQLSGNKENDITAIEEWRDKSLLNASSKLPAQKEDFEYDLEHKANEFIRESVGSETGFVGDKANRIWEGLAKPFFDLADKKSSERYYARNYAENPEHDQDISSAFASGIGQLTGQIAIGAALTYSGQPQLIAPTFGALYGAQYFNEGYTAEMERSGNKSIAIERGISQLPAAALDTFSDAFLLRVLGKSSNFAKSYAKATTEEAKRALIKEAIPSVAKEMGIQFLSEGLIGGAGADIASNLGHYEATGDEKYLKNASDIQALAKSAFVEGTLGALFGGGVTAFNKSGAQQNTAATLSAISEQKAKASEILEALKAKDFNKVITLTGKTVDESNVDQAITEYNKVIEQPTPSVTTTDTTNGIVVSPERQAEIKARAEQNIINRHIAPIQREVESLLKIEQEKGDAADKTVIDNLTTKLTNLKTPIEIGPVIESEGNEIDYNLNVQEKGEQRPNNNIAVIDGKDTKDESIIYVNDNGQLPTQLKVHSTVNGKPTNIAISPNKRVIAIGKGGLHKATGFESSVNPKTGWTAVRITNTNEAGKVKQRVEIIGRVSEVKKTEKPTETKEEAHLNNIAIVVASNMEQMTNDPNVFYDDTKRDEAITSAKELLATIEKSKTQIDITPFQQHLAELESLTKKPTQEEIVKAAEVVDVIPPVITQPAVEQPNNNIQQPVDPKPAKKRVKKPVEEVEVTPEIAKQKAIDFQLQKMQDNPPGSPQHENAKALYAILNTETTESSKPDASKTGKKVSTESRPEQNRSVESPNKTESAITLLRQRNEELPQATRDKFWNESTYTKVENYIETGDKSDLTPVQIKRIDKAVFDSDTEAVARQEAYDREQEAKIAEDEKPEPVIDENVEPSILEEINERRSSATPERRARQSAVVDKFITDHGLNPDNVIVVNRVEDLPPVYQNGELYTVPMDTEGFVKGDKIYIILDHILPQNESDEQATLRVLKHEIVGHVKMDKILEGITPEGYANLVEFLKGLTNSKGVSIFDFKAKQYATTDESVIVDEALASIAENYKTWGHTILQKIQDWIRVNFAKLGLRDWSMDDIQAAIRLAVDLKLDARDNNIRPSKAGTNWNGINIRPDNSFKFRLEDNLRFPGLTVADDGTVPVQNLVAKIEKSNAIQFEKALISQLAKSLGDASGRVNIDELNNIIKQQPTVDVTELSTAIEKNPKLSRFAEIQHEFETAGLNLGVDTFSGPTKITITDENGNDVDFGEFNDLESVDKNDLKKLYQEAVDLGITAMDYEISGKSSQAATGKYGVDPYDNNYLKGIDTRQNGLQRAVWSGDLSLNIPKLNSQQAEQKGIEKGLQDVELGNFIGSEIEPKFVSQHYTGDIAQNQLAFVRGAIHEYMEGAILPDGSVAKGGERIFEIWEVQSDWANDLNRFIKDNPKIDDENNIPHNLIINKSKYAYTQEQYDSGFRHPDLYEIRNQNHGYSDVKAKGNTKAEAIENYNKSIDDKINSYKEKTYTPLLEYYETIAYKAAVNFAARNNANIVISDAESVALNEGHDKIIEIVRDTNGKHINDPIEKRGLSAIEALSNIAGGVKIKGESKLPGNGKVNVDENGIIHITKEPFIEGDRQAYDRNGPNILAKLTGSKPVKADMGVHNKVMQGMKPIPGEGRFEETFFDTEEEAKEFAKTQNGGENREIIIRPYDDKFRVLVENFKFEENIFNRTQNTGRLFKVSQQPLRFSKAQRLSSLRGTYGAWIDKNGFVNSVGYQDHFGKAMQLLGDDANDLGVDQIYREMGNRGFARVVNEPNAITIEGKMTPAQRATAEFIGINDEKQIVYNDRVIYTPPIRASKAQQDDFEMANDARGDKVLNDNIKETLKKKIEAPLIIEERGILDSLKAIHYTYLEKPDKIAFNNIIENFVNTRSKVKNPATIRETVNELKVLAAEYSKLADIGEFTYLQDLVPNNPLGQLDQYEDIGQVRNLVEELISRNPVDEFAKLDPTSEQDAQYKQAINELQSDALDLINDPNSSVYNIINQVRAMIQTSSNPLLRKGLEYVERQVARTEKVLHQYLLNLIAQDSDSLSKVDARKVYYDLMSIVHDGYPSRINHFISDSVRTILNDAEVSFRTPYKNRLDKGLLKVESFATKLRRLATDNTSVDALNKILTPIREGILEAERFHDEVHTPYLVQATKNRNGTAWTEQHRRAIGIYAKLRQTNVNEKPSDGLLANIRQIQQSNKEQAKNFDPKTKEAGAQNTNALNQLIAGIDLENVQDSDMLKVEENALALLGQDSIDYVSDVVALFETLKPLSKLTTEFVYGRPFMEVNNYIPSMSIAVNGAELDVDAIQLMADAESVRKYGADKTINQKGMASTFERNNKLKSGHVLVLDINHLSDSVGRLNTLDYFTALPRREIATVLDPKSVWGKQFNKFMNDDGGQFKTELVREAVTTMWQNQLIRASYLHEYHAVANWFTRKWMGSVLSGIHQFANQTITNTIPFFVKNITNPQAWADYGKAIDMLLRYNSGNLPQHTMKLFETLLAEIRNRHQDAFLDKGVALHSGGIVEAMKNNMPSVYKALKGSDKVIEKGLMFQFKLSDMVSGAPIMIAEYYANEKARLGESLRMEDMVYNPESLFRAVDETDRFIGVGAISRRGEYLTNRNPGISLARNLLVAFRSFTINNATNFNVERKRFFDSDLSQEERLKSAKYMMGIAMQSAAFQGIKVYINMMLASGIISLLRNPDDDDELKALYRKSAGQLDEKQRRIIDAEIAARQQVRNAFTKLTERNDSSRILAISMAKDTLSNMFVTWSLVPFGPDLIIHNTLDAGGEEQFKQLKAGEIAQIEKLIKRHKALGNNNIVAILNDKLDTINKQEFLPSSFEEKSISGLGGSFGGAAKAIEGAMQVASDTIIKTKDLSAKDVLALTSVIGLGQPDIKKFAITIERIQEAEKEKQEKIKKSYEKARP